MITLSSIISLSIERKFHAKSHSSHQLQATSRDQGSGSMDSGFTCPRFTIIDVTDNYNKIVLNDVFFEPKKLTNPVGADEKMGWVFKTKSSNFGTSSENLLKKIGKRWNEWLTIPYRYINNNVNYYTNDSNWNKRITIGLKNDDNQTFALILELPYATVGNYLSDDDGKTLQDNVNKDRAYHQNNIKTAKTDIITQNGIYKPNKEFYNAALSDEATLLKEKDKKEVEKKNNIQIIFEATRDADALDDQIKKDKEELRQKQDEKNTLEQSYQNKDKESVSITNSIKVLDDNSANTNDLKTKLEAAIKKALADVDTQAGVLKTEAPQRTLVVDDTKSAVLGLDSNKVTANLEKIAP